MSLLLGLPGLGHAFAKCLLSWQMKRLYLIEFLFMEDPVVLLHVSSLFRGLQFLVRYYFMYLLFLTWHIEKWQNPSGLDPRSAWLMVIRIANLSLCPRRVWTRFMGKKVKLKIIMFVLSTDWVFLLCYYCPSFSRSMSSRGWWPSDIPQQGHHKIA